MLSGNYGCKIVKLKFKNGVPTCENGGSDETRLSHSAKIIA